MTGHTGRGHRPHVGLVELPFTGRSGQLAVLLDRIDSSLPTVVVGHAGIGKSRLLGELHHVVDPLTRIVTGRGNADLANAPYAALREVAAHMTSILEPSALEWSEGIRRDLGAIFPHLGATDATRAPDASRRHSLWMAFGRYCHEVAALGGPLVIAFDDAQWIDAESLGLVRWLADQPNRPALVVATRPPVPAAVAHLDTLALAGLDLDDVGGLLAQLNLRVDPAAVYGSTDGHPQLLREWFTARQLGVEDGSATSSLTSLDSSARAIVESAAVAGAGADRAMLAVLSGLTPTELVEGIDRAVRSGILAASATGAVSFSHDTHREAVLDQIDRLKRGALHRAVLGELERRHGDDPATLTARAHHATAASIDGDVQPAIHYHLEAGRRARAHLAPDSAHDHFSIALELCNMEGDAHQGLRCQLEQALSLVAVADPAAEPVLDRVYREATRLNEPEIYAMAALAQPSTTGSIGISFLGDPAAASRLANARLRLPDDHALQARLAASLAIQQHATLTEREYFDLIEESEVIAAQQQDRELEMTAFLARHAIRRPSGQLDALRDRTRDLLATMTGDDPFFLPVIDQAIVAEMRAGAFSNTAQLQRRLMVELDPMPPIAKWTLLRTQAALAHARGDVVEFEQLAFEAMQEAAGARYENAATAYFGFQVATLLRERRQTDEAGPAVDQWVSEHPTYPAFRAARAWLRGDVGDQVGARSDLAFVFAQDLNEYVSRVEGLPLVAMATAAVFAIDDSDSADRCHGLLAPFHDEWIIIGGGTVVDGPALRPMALASTAAGHVDRALEEIDEAIERTVASGASLIETTCHRDRGYVLRAAGRAREARATLEMAADRYEAVGLDAFASQVREDAARLDAGRATVGISPAPTSTEVAVLRREGRSWLVGFGDATGHVADVKGLRVLELLVQRPHQGIASADLSRLIEGRDPLEVPSPTGQAMLDDQARSDYRRRVLAIGEELDRADRRGDTEASERLHEELAVLTGELEHASGFAGRARAFTDDDERARVRIRKLVGTALRHIATVSPALEDHLRRNVRTGVVCVYEPDPRAGVDWQR